MKLNKQAKDELRAKIVEQLSNVPSGQRIHLDKDLLEKLLFNTFKYKNGEEEIFGKCIVWSGPFLSKIDLSEVSFDDVIWDNPASLSEYNGNDNVESIDLSNTNVRIDFSQSFYAKGKFETQYIQRCNFENVNLSNNKLGDDVSYFIDDCNFTYTNLKINLNSKTLKIYDTIMDGLDFSLYAVDESYFKDYGDSFAVNCSFRNTRLDIFISPQASDEDKLFIGRAIKDGRFDGCRVNRKEIESKDLKRIGAERTRDAYEKMKDDIFDSALGSIEEQISNMKR